MKVDSDNPALHDNALCTCSPDTRWTSYTVYLNADLKKCTIDHILITWHQVIIIGFQINKNAPPWTEIFDR